MLVRLGKIDLPQFFQFTAFQAFQFFRVTGLITGDCHFDGVDGRFLPERPNHRVAIEQQIRQRRSGPRETEKEDRCIGRIDRLRGGPRSDILAFKKPMQVVDLFEKPLRIDLLQPFVHPAMAVGRLE